MVLTLLVSSSEFVQGFLSSRPCRSRRSSHHLGVGQVSRWWYVLISLSLLHRGEAINPGPPVGAKIRSGKLKTWSMGTFNPSGLGGKHQVISSYLNDCNLWAVTETHLTSQGMRSFRQGLKWSDSKFDYCIGGQPVPLRSHSCASGHWNGVAIISKSPTRAVPIQWDHEVFASSRVQVAATLCEDMWITGGVLYGEPPGVGHPNARENTDMMALEMVSHLCQMSGLRYFAGDLNFEMGGLEVFRVLSDAGFKDIQEVAFEKWGQPIQPTCKQKTRKDFFFISRELIPFLAEVKVDATVWADHAVLQGFFTCGPTQLTRHHWRQPGVVEWPSTFSVEFSQSFHDEADPSAKYAKMWHEVESSGSVARVAAGQPPLRKQQCGRGATLTTKLVTRTFHLGPVKSGRPTDVQPLFAGLSQQHAHWFRQLRRIQSYMNFRKVHLTDTSTGHGVALWSSILRAKGFESNFAWWWNGRSSRVFGAPHNLPLFPPDWEVAKKIYDSFLIDVRRLEQQLKSQCTKHSREKRQELAHLIFKDIRKTAPDRVDVLLKTQHGQIAQVDDVSNSFLVTDTCKLSLQHPVFVGGGKVSVIHISNNQVWVTDVSGVQVKSARKCVKRFTLAKLKICSGHLARNGRSGGIVTATPR